MKSFKKSSIYHVLLVEENSEGVELCTELIQKVAPCKIDVLNRPPNFLEWVDLSHYHLMIIVENVRNMKIQNSLELTGLVLLEQIRRVSPGTSVILISEKATVEDAVAAVRLGAEDYLAKPLKVDAFQLAVKRSLDNTKQYIGMQHLVYLDDATGLYNTRYLNYILDREITYSQITNKSFAVLFIDVDRFKLINDNYGHVTGTKLLNEFGAHFKKYVREQDIVFRYGGDEFIAVLTSCDLTTAKAVANRIRDSVEKKRFLKEEGLKIRFTVSIGVALFPDHARTKKEILEAADSAMYHAKKASRRAPKKGGKSGRR